MKPLQLAFDRAELERAHDAWGCNCGPGALAAVLGLRPDDVRPHLPGFERKRYTNPMMMLEALLALQVDQLWRPLKPMPPHPDMWPAYGLARIQWEGPWTAPGVPMRARYRQTHWVGFCRAYNGDVGIFDINAMDDRPGSGWCSLWDWSAEVVPWLLKEAVPRASGHWHATHFADIRSIRRLCIGGGA